MDKSLYATVVRIKMAKYPSKGMVKPLAQAISNYHIHFASDLVAKNTQELTGVVLFELMTDGKLKAETFPGRSANQVTGFTSSAQIYER